MIRNSTKISAKLSLQKLITNWCVDWSTVVNGTTIDDASANFCRYLARDQFVPVRVRGMATYPPWFTAEIKNIITEKKIAHKCYQLTRNVTEEEAYGKYVQIT